MGFVGWVCNATRCAPFDCRFSCANKFAHPTWLREGLAALPAERLAEISRDITALAGQTSRPVVCPLLDQASGACPVYAHRPVACRTYGFYAQRDKGLYCGDIEARVAEGKLADVIWGNHDAIDQQLAGLGEKRLLTEWFADWER